MGSQVLLVRVPARIHACSSQTKWQWVPLSERGLRYSRSAPKGDPLGGWAPVPGEPRGARDEMLVGRKPGKGGACRPRAGSIRVNLELIRA